MCITIVDDTSFYNQVIDSKGLTVVEFHADWCEPCHEQAPILEKLARTYADKIKFTSCDTDINPASANKYQVHSIPTLMIFHDGQLVARKSGLVEELELLALLDSLLQ